MGMRERQNRIGEQKVVMEEEEEEKEEEEKTLTINK